MGIVVSLVASSFRRYNRKTRLWVRGWSSQSLIRETRWMGCKTRSEMHLRSSSSDQLYSDPSMVYRGHIAMMTTPLEVTKVN